MMEDLITVCVGAVVGSLGAVGTVSFVIKYVIRKLIDERFERFEKTLGERLELQAEVTRRYLEKESGIYPTISELIYRAKAGADRVRPAKTNVELLDADVAASCRELTEQLYRFRLYLPEDIFHDLHRYKHLLQDLLVIADILTRPEPPKAVKELPPDVQARVKSLCDEVGTSCDSIIKTLRQRVRSLEGALASE